MTDYTYPGEELDIFTHATNWKSYWASKVAPYLGANVLEVGAGMGSNTALLYERTVRRWVCLEPDPALAERIPKTCEEMELVGPVEVVVGTLADLPPEAQFDTVLYIDVLEHIEDDRAELARAVTHLKGGGNLIVLAPAHPRLFSPFDRAVGHYRRYTWSTLSDLSPPRVTSGRFGYLDSAGALASMANRYLLRSSMPTVRQVQTWDRCLVPLSRWLDPLTGAWFGKSILGIWAVIPAFENLESLAEQVAENK